MKGLNIEQKGGAISRSNTVQMGWLTVINLFAEIDLGAKTLHKMAASMDKCRFRLRAHGVTHMNEAVHHNTEVYSCISL